MKSLSIACVAVVVLLALCVLPSPADAISSARVSLKRRHQRAAAVAPHQRDWDSDSDAEDEEDFDVEPNPPHAAAQHHHRHRFAKDSAPSVECSAATLSAIRQRMFTELDAVIPSVQGVRKASGRNLFDGTHQMTQAEYDAKHAAHQPIVTTCGMLPGVMLGRLGVKGPLAASGTEGVRICGRALGATVWKENDGTNLPKPGDVYVLRYPATPNLDSVAHVGIYCSANGATWKTVDAGQGSATQQEAKIVTRHMKEDTGNKPMLSGPGTIGDAAEHRRIGGWIDLDALMDPAMLAKANALHLTVHGNSATCA